MDDLSFIGNADLNTIEYLYKEYLKNPDNVDNGWQSSFKDLILQKQIMKKTERFLKLHKRVSGN